jgi:hypothetical protein
LPRFKAQAWSRCSDWHDEAEEIGYTGSFRRLKPLGCPWPTMTLGSAPVSEEELEKLASTSRKGKPEHKSKK